MDNETSIISSLKKGAKAYLTKDMHPNQLKNALDEIRDKGIYFNDLLSHKMFNYVTESPENDQVIIANLSERELTFLKLACTEKTYREIAEAMNFSPRTIEGTRDDLFVKLSVMSRVGLVLFAIKNGLHKI